MIPSVLDIILGEAEDVSKAKDTRFEPSETFTKPMGVGHLAAGAPSSKKLGSIRGPGDPEISPEGVHEETPANDEIWDNLPEWGGSDPPSSIPTRHPAGGGSSFDHDRAALDSNEALVNEIGLENALKVIMGSRHPKRVQDSAEERMRAEREKKRGYTRGGVGKKSRVKIPEDQWSSLHVGADRGKMQENLRRKVSRSKEAADTLRRILSADADEGDLLDDEDDYEEEEDNGPDDFYADDSRALREVRADELNTRQRTVPRERGPPYNDVVNDTVIDSDGRQPFSEWYTPPKERGPSYKDSPEHQAARAIWDPKLDIQPPLGSRTQQQIDQTKTANMKERLAARRAKSARNKKREERGQPINMPDRDFQEEVPEVSEEVPETREDNPILEESFFDDMAAGQEEPRTLQNNTKRVGVKGGRKRA